MGRFAGIDLISDRIPEEKTILSFRHLLEKSKFGKEFFDVVKAHLKQRGDGHEARHDHWCHLDLRSQFHPKQNR